MSDPAVVIKDYWADTADSVAQGLARLNAVLAELDHLPQDIVIVSAGEVKLLLNPLVSVFCQQLAEKASCSLNFISAACTSFHAAVLDFNQSDSTERLVITLELDQALQQGCLNSLGIGNDPEQDGLSVINCSGFCLLSKETPDQQSLIIEDCTILSQPIGMMGTQMLLKQLGDQLKQLPVKSQPISFDICSLWGKKLLKGLSSRLCDLQTPDYWLPSIEHDQQHYLSLKPLLELQQHQQYLHQGNLFMMTLGGGGRIGCLRLSRGMTNIQMNATSSVSEHNLTDDLKEYDQALGNDVKSDYYQGVKNTLKYPRHQYRGINNHYFRWSLEPLISNQHIAINTKSGANR